jgi:hypothetical protein
MNDLEKIKKDNLIVEYQGKASTCIEEAENFNIESQEDVNIGVGFMGCMIRSKRVIEKELNPHIKKAHELHKGLTNLRGKMIDNFKEAESIVKEKLANYVLKQKEPEMKFKTENENLHFQDDINLTIIDKLDFILEFLENPILPGRPIDIIEINMGKLKKYIKQHDLKDGDIGGLKIEWKSIPKLTVK